MIEIRNLRYAVEGYVKYKVQYRYLQPVAIASGDAVFASSSPWTEWKDVPIVDDESVK